MKQFRRSVHLDGEKIIFIFTNGELKFTVCFIYEYKQQAIAVLAISVTLPPIKHGRYFHILLQLLKIF